LQPEKPRIENTWTFWQHSEKGRVDGIRAPVDFNIFNGDSADFKNLLIGN
jgi:lysozyme